MIEALEWAASEFSLKHTPGAVQIAPEVTVAEEIGASDGTEEKPLSCWRLHLGNRPSELDGSIGNLPSVSR